MDDITSRFLKIYNDLIDLKKVENPSDFAKKIGVSPSMITEILKNRSNAGIKVVQNTVTTFKGYDIKWLITGDGRMREKFMIPELHYNPDEEYAIRLLSTPLVTHEAAAGFGN